MGATPLGRGERERRNFARETTHKILRLLLHAAHFVLHLQFHFLYHFTRRIAIAAAAATTTKQEQKSVVVFLLSPLLSRNESSLLVNTVKIG